LVRLFYTLLYVATVALAIAWWVQRDESATSWGDLIGLRQANAQTPAGSPTYGQAPAPSQFGVGFIPPSNPAPVSRPPGWVGGPAANVASIPAGAPPGYPTTGNLPSPEQPLEGTQRIAQVGNEFILLADVIGQVNEVLAANADRIPPNQLDQARTMLIKQRLEQLIETKLVVAELRRKIPSDNLKKIESSIGNQFEENEIPKAMLRSNVKNRTALEEDLKTLGSSIDRERRMFTERMLAMSWVQQNVKFDEEVTHEQMLEYYQKHLASYEEPGRAKWQQIHVRFDKYPNKQAAYAALAAAGNEVLGGADFAAVAQKTSHGFTSDKGGLHDWTTQGSLSSDALNEALFALPIGQMSPILEDARGFHIIKVVDRKLAGRRPFLEVQNEIAGKIKQERAGVASAAYLKKLKETTQVWTLFDSTRPLPNSESPSEVYKLPPAGTVMR